MIIDGKGKIAVVTGSRRGIGLGIAKKLAENGYTVVMSATAQRENVTELLNEFSANGWSADYIKCDVSNTQERKALVEAVIEKYGKIDVFVNNAGVAPLERLDILETTEESFDRLMNTNLKGTFFLTQLAANAMIAKKHELEEKGESEGYSPRIVNISSVSVYASSTNRGEYCISKAGISMTTTLFADRLAEEGIPVFEVRPGIILTDMTAKVQGKYKKMIEEDGVTPIRRFGTPEDVADSVLAACSGLMDFSSGQVLNADGGFHIRRL